MIGFDDLYAYNAKAKFVAWLEGGDLTTNEKFCSQNDAQESSAGEDRTTTFVNSRWF